jgi:hypothetical protein
MKNRTDFSSRIGVRAVTAGVMTSTAFMLFALSLIAALGFWNFNLNELSTAGTPFWIAVSIAWVLSLYFSGLVASLCFRSQNNLEGMLNAITACCGSFLFCIFGFLFFAPGALETLLVSGSQQFFLRAFLGNFLAFALGIYGGVIGVHFEQRSIESFKEKRRYVHS